MLHEMSSRYQDSLTINPLTPSVGYIGHLRTKERVTEQSKTKREQRTNKNSGVKGLKYKCCIFQQERVALPPT